MSVYVSYPIPTRPGDLPDLTDEQLLAQGFISGFRTIRVDEATAALHLAAASYQAGWKCHASTEPEIVAEEARAEVERGKVAASGSYDVRQDFVDRSPG